jgi:hypothetical protein
MTLLGFVGITGQMVCYAYSAGVVLPSTGTDAGNCNAALGRASH